jgi:O-antigen/teichoic acid export membrane protein
VAKIVLLFACAAALPASGLFVAWTAPLLPAVLVVNYLIFRRLISRETVAGSLDRGKMISMATGNYGGNLFGLIGMFFLPILVANVTSAKEAAYFYVPWLICTGMQLVAINVMTSLTVEAALDMPNMASLSRRAVIHTARLVLPLAALTALLAPWGLLAFGHDYADAGTALLRWLALGSVPNIVVSLGVSIGRIEHRGRIVAAAQAGSTVLVVGLSAALLPVLGITGVGIAWTASQTLVAAVMLATMLRPMWQAQPVSG